MKQAPTNGQIAYIFFMGLGLLSIGVLLFWVPYIGPVIGITGAIFMVLAVTTIIVKITTKQ